MIVYEQADESSEHEVYLLQQLTSTESASKQHAPAVQPLQAQHESFESLDKEARAYRGLCWHCTLTCEDAGYPLVSLKNKTFKIKAVMCSFPCLVTYINSVYKHNRQKRDKAINMAKQVFLTRYGF